MPDSRAVTGRELLRHLRRVARKRGVVFAIDASRGKGDHVTVWFGPRFTILGDRGELKTGTLHGMLKQLGLRLEDLQ